MACWKCIADALPYQRGPEMNLRFLTAFAKVMDIEGGEDPHEVTGDPGGRTAWGVSERAHPELWRDGPPDLADAVKIYWDAYWTPLRLEQVHHPDAQFELFEMAMNAGIRASVLAAQRAVNRVHRDRPDVVDELAEDGRIGPRTVGQINRLTRAYPHAFVARFNQAQMEYYDSLGSELRSRFIMGWKRRVVVT